MYELQVLNRVLDNNSIQLLTFNNITEDYFTTYKDQYKFIINFYNKYNKVPSKETIQSQFVNNFEWLTVSDPDDFLIDRLKEEKQFRDFYSKIKEAVNYMTDGKTDKAIEIMQIATQQATVNKQHKCIDLIGDVKERYDGYIERVNNPNKSFVSTGLKELDDILGGWDLLNESATICARTGIGKSWMLIYFAAHAAKEGLRVGYYSGEMETDLVGYRLDTFLGGIANGSLTHGNENIKDKYKNYVDTLNTVIKGHVYCITPDDFDGRVTISKLKAFIEKYDIQMLCVDQFSLLDDERGAKTPREQYMNLSKDLRALQRLKKIPILSAVQLNRFDDRDGQSPTTKNIAESDRIGQDSTTVLIVERKNDNLILTIDKSRNAKSGDKLTYFWNTNMGILNYIPSEADALQGNSGASQDDYDDSMKSDTVF